MSKRLSVEVICGGTSGERGISLNSARSVNDHLSRDRFDVSTIYFGPDLRPYRLSEKLLYSNTPSDFDFKLDTPLSQAELGAILTRADLVFPLIHGGFGEDGRLQQMLEGLNVPFVGSSSSTCYRAYNKVRNRKEIASLSIDTLPCIAGSPEMITKELIQSFMDEHKVKRVAVKPSESGSSLGVSIELSAEEAETAVRALKKRFGTTEVVIEPVIGEGREFSIIVLVGKDNQPVALLPTEVELLNADERTIFSYRHKYLASRSTVLHSPPRFSPEIVSDIREKAGKIFTHFGMHDFVRMDGWVLPNGKVLFTDMNIISGAEQNSFLFIQGSGLGMSHADMLEYIIESACLRYNIEMPKRKPDTDASRSPKKKVAVLFGGATAERQVSVLSGTNVWLKLRGSNVYEPVPYLLSMDEKTVWRVPYSFALRHTVEEMQALCETRDTVKSALDSYKQGITPELRPAMRSLSNEDEQPQSMTLEEFVASQPAVFITLHGGIGENGTLQEMFTKAGTIFTGSGADGSRLGMNKFETGKIVEELSQHGISAAPRVGLDTETLLAMSEAELRKQFAPLLKSVGSMDGSHTFIIKPNDDGCSAGVVRIATEQDLVVYVEALRCGAENIPGGKLALHSEIIDMPTSCPKQLLAEQYVVTDEITINGKSLDLKRKSGWIEVTIGVVGHKGKMHAMPPSLTVAAGNVLSLEEKFMGGTGVNITPPPTEFVSESSVQAARKRIEKVAEAMGIAGYARIDCFLKCDTGEIIVIEANTNPGLTPSTVFYHQALADDPSRAPRGILEVIVGLSENEQRAGNSAGKAVANG